MITSFFSTFHNLSQPESKCISVSKDGGIIITDDLPSSDTSPFKLIPLDCNNKPMKIRYPFESSLEFSKFLKHKSVKKVAIQFTGDGQTKYLCCGNNTRWFSSDAKAVELKMPKEKEDKIWIFNVERQRDTYLYDEGKIIVPLSFKSGEGRKALCLGMNEDNHILFQKNETYWHVEPLFELSEGKTNGDSPKAVVDSSYTFEKHDEELNKDVYFFHSGKH